MSPLDRPPGGPNTGELYADLKSRVGVAHFAEECGSVGGRPGAVDEARSRDELGRKGVAAA
jgi:hypothetical protein